MDPFDNITADDGAALDIFCGAPQIDYWVTVGGMIYPAACDNDDAMEALRQTGHVVWKTVDGQRV